MTWTVHPVVDCLHEPAFPGDRAVYHRSFRAELNHVEVRPGVTQCDDSEEFSNEPDAKLFCDRMNGKPPREETVYEKSARWAWPDGRPDL